MTLPRGLSAFPITPMDADGRVDAAAFRAILARLVDAGVDSIGVLGSTGTYMFLDRAQRRRAIELAVETAAGRTAVIAGVGALRTDDAVAFAQDAAAIGATAGLLAAVSYTPLTADEVFEHFMTVARESSLPICIYDNPTTTRFSFTPALVARLAREPGIVGIKNPTENPEATVRHLAEQRAATPDGFSSGYSGDWNCAEAMIAGADVWYSAFAGLLPDICLAITRAAQAGDPATARALNATLAPLWSLARTHSSLRILYALANHLGLTTAEPPRPILPLADAIRREAVAALAGLSAP